jgi:hypothetical protein
VLKTLADQHRAIGDMTKSVAGDRLTTPKLMDVL